MGSIVTYICLSGNPHIFNSLNIFSEMNDFNVCEKASEKLFCAQSRKFTFAEK